MSSGSAGAHLSFVISSHKPYYVDFNHILAFPSGFKYRSRFQRRWIITDLHQNIGMELVGERVLLLLRDADHNTVIPVRWGTIKTAQMIGEIAYFEYILGDLVEYSDSEQVRDREIVECSKKIAERHPWLPGRPAEPLQQPAVFRSDVGNLFRAADASDLTAWGNVVAAVAHADIYERTEFLKIVGLYRAGARDPVPVAKESFVVKPGASYVLRIFQTVPRPGGDAVPPPHEIRVKTFSEHIIALPEQQQAVGKYDLLEFSLKVRSLAPREPTTIMIPHNPAAAVNSQLPADLRIPVVAEQASRWAVGLWVVTALISLVLIFRPGLAGPLPTDEVRNLATVGFVLLIAGKKLTIAGLWPSLPPWRAER